jgi:ferritin-like protein
MSSESYHEPYDKLSTESLELHRAVQSLKEELDAVDWYQQRIDASTDPELKAILAHNRDEEKEHAAMIMEWIRRHDAAFAAAMKTYLFTEGDLIAIEEAAEAREAAEAQGAQAREQAGAREAPAAPAAASVSPSSSALTIGPLKLPRAGAPVRR